MSDFQPLTGVRVVTLALNVPGPIAADKLAKMGAEVIKIEPPTGDPLKHYSSDWYSELSAKQKVISCNLKTEQGMAELLAILATTDLLITAQRPSALERLGLSWQQLKVQFPKLSYLAIVGHSGKEADKPGHDLTYQAKLGLLTPPQMPKILLADMVGAEKAFSMALAAILNNQKTAKGSYIEVALEDAAIEASYPFTYGVTDTGGLLSGALAEYALYETAKGWLAVAALEPHFKKRLQEKLGLEKLTKDSVGKALMGKTADEWEQWGGVEDIPLSAIR